MFKQTRPFTSRRTTESLKALGITPKSNEGFQIYELLKLFPSTIEIPDCIEASETGFSFYYLKIRAFRGQCWLADIVKKGNSLYVLKAFKGKRQLVELLPQVILYMVKEKIWFNHPKYCKSKNPQYIKAWLSKAAKRSRRVPANLIQ